MERFIPQSNPTELSTSGSIRILALSFLIVCGSIILLVVGTNYHSLAPDAPQLADSTLVELATWMMGQAEEEAPPSLLGGLAKRWFATSESANANSGASNLIQSMQTLVLIWCVGAALILLSGIYGLLNRFQWTTKVLLTGLIGLDGLLFLIPTNAGDTIPTLILIGIMLILLLLLVAPVPTGKLTGFLVVISTILVLWEVGKALADSINYAVTTPQSAWTYTPYPTLDEALTALDTGEVSAVFADENDFETVMAAYPDDQTSEEAYTYPNLRYLARIQQREQVMIFPVSPALPGRLSIAVRAEDAARYTSPSQLIGATVGAVDGEFAVERFLAVPRHLVLLDLQILNDLNLPHLQSIAEAFFQPARRNGEFLLARILSDAGLYTWREAVFGFGFGTILGLLLGTGFAYSRLIERALLPYVVASQTVPILAIAPMVVIWLGASFISVAVIAAYITFFPVTINTLRGLQSPNPIAVELMDSYAAGWWAKLWKLRFPAAVPYIFAALKVSATASVVGAIIGELPSGIGDGLGRAILDFSSDYSLVSTPKLWAAIITAAFVGIMFFIAVSITESIVLRRYVRNV